LADHFDIHGGGMDLRFPHHENEIAQTEGATGSKFVNTWMHNGFVQIDEEKMSKSLGNFFTIRDIVGNDTNPARAGEVVRFLMLLSHYRSPLNFSDVVLDQARTGLERLYAALYKVHEIAPQAPSEPGSDTLEFVGKFDAALEDDFNTPSAIAVLFDMVKRINRAIESEEFVIAVALGSELQNLAGRLGLLYQDPAVMLRAGSVSDNVSGAAGEAQNILIEDLVQKRSRARLDKDFQTSDKVRTQLEEMGVVLEDRPDGSTFWRQR
jgi:cysteinyl-tRNA synthetase